MRALCETKYKIRSNLTEKIVNNQVHHDIIAIRHILLNFDSWYTMRFLIILIVLLSLLPVSLASAQSTSSVAVAQVVTKPQRVIITLRSSVGFESRNFSANQLSARRAQVRQTQTSFITRQKTRLRAIKRQMTVFPIIVADINTADIALLQKDSAVQNVQIDVAVPPTLYETNVTIGARTLQNAGYGGANTSVAVLDTGVKKSHPFLSGKVIYEL
jgi:subtilisin family serine protease